MKILGYVAVLAFIVNIATQITKGIVKLPTKLWAIILSIGITALGLIVAVSYGVLDLTIGNIALSILGSIIVAHIAIFGFDTTLEIWKRFRGDKHD